MFDAVASASITAALFSGIAIMEMAKIRLAAAITAYTPPDTRHQSMCHERAGFAM